MAGGREAKARKYKSKTCNPPAVLFRGQIKGRLTLYDVNLKLNLWQGTT